MVRKTVDRASSGTIQAESLRRGLSHLKSFCRSQLPHKSVNLSLPIIQKAIVDGFVWELTLKNDFTNAFCEISFAFGIWCLVFGVWCLVFGVCRLWPGDEGSGRLVGVWGLRIQDFGIGMEG